MKAVVVEEYKTILKPTQNGTVEFALSHTGMDSRFRKYSDLLSDIELDDRITLPASCLDRNYVKNLNNTPSSPSGSPINILYLICRK